MAVLPNNSVEQKSPHRRGRQRLRNAAVVVLGLAVVWYGGTEVLVACARFQVRARHPDTALSVIRWLEVLRPGSGEPAYLAARCYRRLGDMDAAGRKLDQAAELGIAAVDIQRERWLILAQAGAMRQAEPHLQTLLVAPGADGAEICEAYVCGFLVNYQFGQASGLLDAWQADFPDDAQPWFFRGQCSEHLADTQGAAEAYRQALKLDETRSDIRTALVRTLLELHQYEDAQSHLASLLADETDDVVVHTLAAETHRQMAKNSEAESGFRRACELDPTHIPARVGLIRVLLSLQNTEAATHMARELVADRPRNSECLFLLQQAVQMSGLDDEAQSIAERRQELQEQQERARLLMEKARFQPDDPALRFEIGSILFSHGEPEDARAWLRSVIQIAPGHEQAQQLLEQLDSASQ